MTVREPLASLGRESAARAEKTVRKRPHRPPGPSDAAPERAAAVPGEASRRCQAQQGKMFNVESVERVELCESLLTWIQTFNVDAPCQTVEDLTNGVVMAQVLQKM